MKDDVMAGIEDGVLTDIEKSRIEASLDSLRTQKSDVEGKYLQLRNHEELPTTNRTRLTNAYNNYITEYRAVLSYVDFLLDKDTITDAEKETYALKIDFCLDAYETYQDVVVDCINAIAQAKDDKLKGDMTSYVNAEIKVQSDRITSTVEEVRTLNGNVSSMQSSITQLSGQITSKVDVNGVKSIIEQNPNSVKIGFNGISNSIVISSSGLDLYTTTGLLHTRLTNGTLNFQKKDGSTSLGSFRRTTWVDTTVEALSCSMDEQTTFDVSFHGAGVYYAKFVVSNKDFKDITTGTNIFTNLNMHNAPITNCASISCTSINCTNIRATGIIETSSQVQGASIYSSGNIRAVGSITADTYVNVGSHIKATGYIKSMDEIQGIAGVYSGNHVEAEGNIVSLTGNIFATSGQVRAKTISSDSWIQAVGNIVATTGNIQATNGSIYATNGQVKSSSVSASDWIQAVNNIKTTSGSISASNGNVFASSGQVKANTVYSNTWMSATNYITHASVSLFNEKARTVRNVEIETEATMSMTPNIEHIGSSEVINGECVVTLPLPITRLGTNYVVQITPIGLGNIYVAEKNSDSFIVKGDDLEFDYVIKMKKAKAPGRLRAKVVAVEEIQEEEHKPVANISVENKMIVETPTRSRERIEAYEESIVEPIIETIIEEEVIPDVLTYTENDIY